TSEYRGKSASPASPTEVWVSKPLEVLVFSGDALGDAAPLLASPASPSASPVSLASLVKVVDSARVSSVSPSGDAPGDAGDAPKCSASPSASPWKSSDFLSFSSFSSPGDAGDALSALYSNVINRPRSFSR